MSVFREATPGCRLEPVGARRVIRGYGDSDIEDVIRVWRCASRIAHPFLTREFMSVEEERIRNVYMPTVQSHVCEDHGQIVGFIAMMGNEIGALFVLPEQHGRGVGSALVDTVRALHETLEVEVFEANTIGRSFYEKYGFELIDRHIHDETGQPSMRLRYRASSP